MDDLSGKPIKSARQYYVKLFCSRYKSKSSKRSRGVRKALQSWWSLSAAEQQPFIEKFNLIQEKHKGNCINYLKSVEPFMKRKVIRALNSDPNVSKPEIRHEDNHLQPVVDNSQDRNESISNEESDQNNKDNTVSATNLDVNDSASLHEIIDATSESEQISRIPEPTAPCASNGKELFEMVTNASGENNLEWKSLSQAEKYKYRSAVIAIKREYIKEYQNYLESLPPIKLFQHYIKTLEKCRLFFFLHLYLYYQSHKKLNNHLIIFTFSTNFIWCSDE